MSVLSSPEIITATENTAIQKISFSTRKTLTLAILAGIYIAMGGLLSLVIGYGFPEITTNNPGLQRLLSGAMFPLGLILVVFAGAELFTGNNAVLIPGLCNHKYGLIPVLRNWLLVYIGNFIGAIFFVYVMVYLADIVKSDPWNTAIQNIAEAKVGMSWGVTFIKGIGANWFVCLAVWLGIACRSAAGKFIGLWFPVMCFVALGYEHSIANMFSYLWVCCRGPMWRYTTLSCATSYRPLSGISQAELFCRRSLLACLSQKLRLHAIRRSRVYL